MKVYYGHGTGGISNCWKRLLHVVLRCAPAIIVMISFVSESLPTVGKVTQKIIPYFIIDYILITNLMHW